jgi:hypothetical protein
MTRKALVWYEEQYFRALSYAIVFRCSLSVEQFAAAHLLDPDELEEWQAYLESQGVGI